MTDELNVEVKNAVNLVVTGDSGVRMELAEYFSALNPMGINGARLTRTECGMV